MRFLLENWRKYISEGEKRVDSDKIAKAVIYDENKVLIVKRSENLEKHAGEWDLPGGHLIEGEDMQDGLQREVWEETGLIIRSPEKLYSQGRDTYFKASMPKNKDISLSDEHTDYLLADASDLDNYDLPSKYLNAIKRAFQQ